MNHLLESVLDPNIPLHTLEELKEHLRVFSNLCVLSRDYVIKTGLMPVTYPDSVWLNNSLWHMYDTRTTSSGFPSPSAGEGLNELAKLDPFLDQNISDIFVKKPFTWIKQSRNGNRTKCTKCSMPQASILDWLSKSEAERIDELRGKVFKAQLDILQELRKSMDERHFDGLLERCLVPFEKHMDWQEIKFCIDISQKYNGISSASVQSFEKWPKFNPGGILSLVEVAAHVENELREGAFHSLAATIKNSNLIKQNYIPDFDEIESFLSSASDSQKVQSELKVFEEKLHLSQEFWSIVNERLKHWLEPSYRSTIPLRVFPRYMQKLRHVLQREADKLTKQFEAGLPMAIANAENLPWWSEIVDGLLIFDVRVVLKNSLQKKILRLLCASKGELVPIDEIDECSSASDEKVAHGNRGLLSNLETKLRKAFRLPKTSDPILNERNLGYRLNCRLLENASRGIIDDPLK